MIQLSQLSYFWNHILILKTLCNLSKLNQMEDRFKKLIQMSLICYRNMQIIFFQCERGSPILIRYFLVSICIKWIHSFQDFIFDDVAQTCKLKWKICVSYQDFRFAELVRLWNHISLIMSKIEYKLWMDTKSPPPWRKLPL